tara:strand:- start:59274 stop:59426 length:153 start_codon:yes stop_codon:yes gene_type:complete
VTIIKTSKGGLCDAARLFLCVVYWAFCWAFALADGRNALKDNGVIGFMVI